VLLDLIGVVYVGGGKPKRTGTFTGDPSLMGSIAGAAEAVAKLKSAGVQYRFVTNESRGNREALIARLQDAGLEDVKEENVFAPAPYALSLIQERQLRPYMLTKPSLLKEFPGIETAYPNAVVVADAEDAFTHSSLTKAFRILMEDEKNAFLALGQNRYTREPEGLSLDVGSYVAALEYATGRKAEIVGKPSPGFFNSAAQAMGVTHDECVMVGDDVMVDVHGAQNAGIRAMLVRTGKYMSGDEEQISPAPWAVADDLNTAVDHILEHNANC
jgi:phospholysine phosphohistidine inorganic pyrophosphate phosphatase